MVVGSGSVTIARFPSTSVVNVFQLPTGSVTVVWLPVALSRGCSLHRVAATEQNTRDDLVCHGFRHGFRAVSVWFPVQNPPQADTVVPPGKRQYINRSSTPNLTDLNLPAFLIGEQNIPSVRRPANSTTDPNSAEEFSGNDHLMIRAQQNDQVAGRLSPDPSGDMLDCLPALGPQSHRFPICRAKCFPPESYTSSLPSFDQPESLGFGPPPFYKGPSSAGVLRR